VRSRAGQDLLMLDPANFGTPLTLLQIPSRSIQRVQDKLADPACTVTYYAQDCRHFGDLRKAVSADDWALARRSALDVGYICRRCHIVYPGRAACTAHQEAQCYRGEAAGATTIVKLEQLQYECAACRSRTSTVADFKAHCAGDQHRRAAAAWLRAHARAAPAASQPAPAAVHRSETPRAAATATPPSDNRADSKPEPATGEETAAVDPAV